MYSSIVIAAALFNEGKTTLELIKKAKNIISENGQITIVHIVEEIPAYVATAIPRDQIDARRKEVEEQLNSLADAAGDTKVHCVTRQGQPANEIINVAEEEGADLIMLASHKPGFSDYFIGSTASKVVRHAKMSVLVSR